MLFNSIAFAVFFVVVYGLYWTLRKHYQVQNKLLLTASFLFYGWWDVRFLYLFILTTTVDFYCALMIEQGRVPLRQRLIESAVLVGSAFLCVTVQWKALSIVQNGLYISAQVDWANLLAAGVTGWSVFIGTVVVVVLVNLADPWLTSIRDLRRPKIFIVASLVSNFIVLGFFKYYNFFASSFSSLIQALFNITPSDWTLQIILPIGISFYTFQSLAYTIDVYRRKTGSVGSYLSLATCLSFFPLLVAGPIERPGHFFHQFYHPRSVSREAFREGLWLITWGLFKKMVVADNMALIVASVFGPFDKLAGPVDVPHDGLRILIGVYAFAMQIYGDFSGYSDIARGTARLLGFDIMLNFNLPYLAVSPSDFWQRWHISLSTWLRDYLYIPLGGNRSGTWRTYCNLSLTMLLGGLWHGAAWTFVLWGAFHGLLLIGYRLTVPCLGERQAVTGPGCKGDIGVGAGSSLAALVSIPLGFFVPAWSGRSGKHQICRIIKSSVVYGLTVLLMFHFTCLGWLLFRAQNLTTVRVFLESIFLHPNWSPEAASHFRNLLFYSWFLILFQIIQAITGMLNPMARWNWFVRLHIWVFLVICLIRLAPATSQEFIYFAF